MSVYKVTAYLTSSAQNLIASSSFSALEVINRNWSPRPELEFMWRRSGLMMMLYGSVRADGPCSQYFSHRTGRNNKCFCSCERKKYIWRPRFQGLLKKKRIHPLMHPSSVLLSVYHRVVLDRWTYVEIINHAALMVTQESSIAGKSVVEEHRKRMESRQTVSTLKY